MTLLYTIFGALPGKWANLSFNPSFDVAFLNNQGFIFLFSLHWFYCRPYPLCAYYFKMLEGFKPWSEGSAEVSDAMNSLFSVAVELVVLEITYRLKCSPSSGQRDEVHQLEKWEKPGCVCKCG